MSFTETIKIPLWNAVDTASLHGERTFESIANEIALSGAFEDELDDSSIDSRLTATASGSGSVVETTQLDLISSSGTDVSAVTCNQPYMRGADWEYKARFIVNSFAAGDVNNVMVSIQKTSLPGAMNNTEIANAHNLAAFQYDATGIFYIRYANTGGTLIYWSGSVWSSTFAFPYTLIAGTEYTLIFESTTTQFRYILKSADELTTHVTTDWVYWSSIKDLGGSYNNYFIFGDNNSTYWTQDISFTYFYIPCAYDTASPSPAQVWEGLPTGSVVDMSTVRIPENMNSVDAGVVKYKYAVNGGAFNGTWLTQAQLRAQSDPTITDATNSIKIVPQYVSDGSQKTTSQAHALVDVAFSAETGTGDVITNRAARLVRTIQTVKVVK